MHAEKRMTTYEMLIPSVKSAVRLYYTTVQALYSIISVSVSA